MHGIEINYTVSYMLSRRLFRFRLAVAPRIVAGDDDDDDERIYFNAA